MKHIITLLILSSTLGALEIKDIMGTWEVDLDESLKRSGLLEILEENKEINKEEMIAQYKLLIKGSVTINEKSITLIADSMEGNLSIRKIESDESGLTITGIKHEDIHDPGDSHMTIMKIAIVNDKLIISEIPEDADGQTIPQKVFIKKK